MPINVGSNVRAHTTPSNTAVDRKPSRVETPPVSPSVSAPVDEFVASNGSNRTQGPAINPDTFTPLPGAGILGSTQAAQEAQDPLRSMLSESLEPFRAQLDQLAGKIPSDMKDEGDIKRFLRDALEGLGIHPRDFRDATDYIQKVHSTNRDRITS